MLELLTYGFLPAILNMTITASLLILLVLAARLPLRRAPKVFSYALWSVVLFRLLCPVSFTSPLSVLGLAHPPVEELAPRAAAVSYVRLSQVEFETAQLQPSPVLTQPETLSPAAMPTQAATHARSIPFSLVALLYLAGLAALVLYSAVSLLLLHRRLVGAVELSPGVWLADHIPTPFVLGLFRPRIYLPSGLSEGERGYILAHEEQHIRRLDHLVKLLAFAALCLHWFNPLVWLAFRLACRDMEMSCDEAVMARMDRDVRADYSDSLLRLATGRYRFSGSPLAFGEGDPKGRVKNILRWKRPKGWVVALAAALCVLLIAACAANPSGDSAATPPPTPTPAPTQGSGETGSETILRVVNGLFIGKYSWDETYQGSQSYTITARDQTNGRTDTYVCPTETAYSLESTPGQRLLSDYDWTAVETSWDPWETLLPGELRDFGDYSLLFDNGDTALLVSSDSNRLLLWENGTSYAFTATPKNLYTGDLFLRFQDDAHSALYYHELGEATSVDGGSRDYQAVAETLGTQYAAALADRPGWCPQQLEDCAFANAEVYDAYYGEDDPNLCMYLSLYVKLTDDQLNWWQAGAGVDPVTEGPYAGWYLYRREATACLGEDGSWRLDGLNTGGASVRLPKDAGEASAQELTEFYFATAGHTHDYIIPYCLSCLPLPTVQDALGKLSEEHCQTLTDGMIQFSHDHPDYCAWTREELGHHSEHGVQSTPIQTQPHSAHHSDAHH